MRVYRAVASLTIDDHLTCLQIVHKHKFVLPALLVRQARMNLLSRVATKAPPQLACLLWAVRDAPRSWWKALVADVQVIAVADAFSCHAVQSVPDAWRLAAASPRRYRAAVAKAIHELAVFEAACRKQPRAMFDSARHICPRCDREFPSKKAMSSHAFRAHRVTRQTRCFVQDGVCIACLQDFSSRPRLIAHLEERSARCKMVVLHTQERLDAATLAVLDTSDAAESRRLVHAGMCSRTALKPVLQTFGPLTLAAHLAGISHRAGLKTATGACYWTDPADS